MMNVLYQRDSGKKNRGRDFVIGCSQRTEQIFRRIPTKVILSDTQTQDVWFTRTKVKKSTFLRVVQLTICKDVPLCLHLIVDNETLNCLYFYI